MQKKLSGLIILAITSPAIANSNFYAGVSLGKTDNKFTSTISSVIFEESFNDSSQFSDDSTSYSIRGGYYFHKNFAVEIGHYEYGEVTASFGDSMKADIETSSNNIGAKAVWPITDSLSLSARLGIAKWDFDYTSTDSSVPGESVNFNESDTDAYYGVGVEYNINDRVNIGLEYSSLSMKWGTSDSNEDFSLNTDTEHEVNSLSLTAQMNF